MPPNPSFERTCAKSRAGRSIQTLAVSMTSPIDQFRSILWNHTDFRVLSLSPEQLVLSIGSALFEGKSYPQNTKIIFFQPTNEWACLWNEKTQEWEDHPDQTHPIGNGIEEGTVKQVGKLKFSFGGHHQLGWARWGFTAEGFQITT